VVGRQLGGRFAERPLEAEFVELPRSEAVDDRPQLVQLRVERFAQGRELRARRRRIAVEEALDDVDAEDHVGKRLSRAVVDLLRDPRPLRVLRLERGQGVLVGRRDPTARLGAEKQPEALERGDGRLETRQTLLASQRRVCVATLRSGSLGRDLASPSDERPGLIGSVCDGRLGILEESVEPRGIAVSPRAALHRFASICGGCAPSARAFVVHRAVSAGGSPQVGATM
jgi:hypothetical protein